MANPQKENGYTVIANEILEALMRIRLSGEEWKCLLVILRKTYGWNKKEDKISLSQFVLMTGMKKQSVHRALKKLSSKNISSVSKKAD
jgi:phage replication O-like protein O